MFQLPSLFSLITDPNAFKSTSGHDVSLLSKDYELALIKLPMGIEIDSIPSILKFKGDQLVSAPLSNVLYEEEEGNEDSDGGGNDHSHKHNDGDDDAGKEGDKRATDTAQSQNARLNYRLLECERSEKEEAIKFLKLVLPDPNEKSRLRLSQRPFDRLWTVALDLKEVQGSSSPIDCKKRTREQVQQPSHLKTRFFPYGYYHSLSVESSSRGERKAKKEKKERLK